MKETQIIKSNLNLFKFTRKTCIRILLTVCLFLLLGKPALAPNSGVPPLNWELYKAKQYESATQLLVLQVGSYIKKYAEDSKLSAQRLIEVCDEYDLDLKLVLAQGHLESHFGTRGAAAETNSVFNVGTLDNGTVLYRYNNPNLSIEPYAQLLRTRYLTSNKSEIDLVQLNQFQDISGKRYASSQSYEQKLLEIISLVSQTTDIDSLTTIRKRFGNIKTIDDTQINYLTTNTIDLVN
jgi:hypothetical protein